MASSGDRACSSSPAHSSTTPSSAAGPISDHAQGRALAPALLRTWFGKPVEPVERERRARGTGWLRQLPRPRDRSRRQSAASLVRAARRPWRPPPGAGAMPASGAGPRAAHEIWRARATRGGTGRSRIRCPPCRPPRSRVRRARVRARSARWRHERLSRPIRSQPEAAGAMVVLRAGQHPERPLGRGGGQPRRQVTELRRRPRAAAGSRRAGGEVELRRDPLIHPRVASAR